VNKGAKPIKYLLVVLTASEEDTDEIESDGGVW
jgi:hypothetical protein